MTLLSRIRRRSPLLVLALLPFLLNSCITPDLMNAQAGALGALGRTGGAGAQNRFMMDQQQTVNQGTALGTGVGAVAGSLLSKKFGVTGLLVGMAAGAIIGNMVGQHVAMKKALAQQSSSNLDAAIKEANANNSAAAKNLSSLKSKLDALRARGAKAKASGNSRELAAVKTELRTLQTTVNNGSKSVGTTNTYLGQLSTAYKGNPKYADIQSGISTSMSTKDGYESLSREIGSALNEF